MPTLAPLASMMRPIVETLVPAAADIDDVRLLRLLQTVDQRLDQQPPAIRRQLALFVRVLWWLPFPRTLHTFGGLSPERRRRFLERLQDAPVQKLRLGLWGLRTLVYLGWYGDPEVAALLGWRPSLEGWGGVRV